MTHLPGKCARQKSLGAELEFATDTSTSQLDDIIRILQTRIHHPRRLPFSCACTTFCVSAGVRYNVGRREEGRVQERVASREGEEGEGRGALPTITSNLCDQV